MTHVNGILEETNWPLLAQQKLHLLEAINLLERDFKERADGLQGILHWMDSLQDAAELDGLPVVFLTAGDDPEQEVTTYAHARGVLLHLGPERADRVMDYSVAGCNKAGRTVTVGDLKDNADHLAEEEGWVLPEPADGHAPEVGATSSGAAEPYRALGCPDLRRAAPGEALRLSKTSAELTALHARLTGGPEWSRPQPGLNPDVLFTAARNNWGRRGQAEAIMEAISLLPELVAEVIALRAAQADPDRIQLAWTTNDVLQVAPQLTQEQARDVLQTVKRKHDAEIGVNWDVLREHAGWAEPSSREQA